MNRLMIYCGGRLATREELFQVPVPEQTPSYVPLPYHSLVSRIERQLQVEGIEILRQEFALSATGQRMFGLMELQMQGFNNREYNCVLGVRNSYDKSISVGAVAGARVMVCDNLSFYGSDFSFARKHSANLLRDLSWLLTEMVAQLPAKFATQGQAFEAYKGTELSDQQAHDAIIRLYDARALNITDVPRVLREWRDPQHLQFSADGKTAWRLLNAATEALKGDLWRLPERTQKVHKVLDAECGLVPGEESCIVA